MTFTSRQTPAVFAAIMVLGCQGGSREPASVPPEATTLSPAATSEAYSPRTEALDASSDPAPLPPPQDPSSITATSTPLHCGSGDAIGKQATCEATWGSPLTPGVASTWFVYDNADCEANPTESWVQLRHCGTDGKGCELHWFGDNRSLQQSGVAGIATGVSRELLGTAKEILLEVRGDGQSYRAQLPMREQARRLEGSDGCNSPHHDNYGTTFTCGDGTTTWHPLRITLEELRQEGWGKRLPLNLSDTALFQVQTVTPTHTMFQCDIRVVAVH